MLYAARHVGLPFGQAWLHGGDITAAALPLPTINTPVMDLPAEFFLGNVRALFHDRGMARRRMSWRGRPVNLAAIRRTALMTIEGEWDDISAPGQTCVAHDLCVNLPVARQRHHLEPQAGHFDLFSGARWRRHVMPALRDFVRSVA